MLEGLQILMLTPADQQYPILVFDKEGDLGVPLAEQMAASEITVLVSTVPPKKTERLLFVPYGNRVPKIPDSIFSSFYIIYTGDPRLLDLLPAFVRKARADNTRIFFILPLRLASEPLLQRVLDTYSRLSVVLIGDVFGEGAFWESPVDDLLTQAERGRVDLPAMGLLPVFPVAAEDVFPVLQSLKAYHSGDKIIYILPPAPLTELSFTRHLAKQEPLLRIDFIETDRKKQVTAYIPNPYVSALGANYRFLDRLSFEMKQQSEAQSMAANRPQRKVRRFPRLAKRRTPVVILLLILLLPILTPLGTFAVASGFFLRASNALQQGDMQKARTAASTAHTFFHMTNKLSGVVLFPLEILGLYDQRKQFSDAVHSGEDASQLIRAAVDGFTRMQAVFSGKSLDSKTDFLSGIKDMKEAFARLSVLKAEGKIPGQYMAQVQRIDRISSQLTNVIDVLPQLIGFEKKQVYLVLFQNNMELRPGGGFIGSYGLVTLDKGQIADFTIQDVYDADGQLKEHIDPPFGIRRYQGGAHWFMRDSNYDISFPTSAATAAYFYNLSMGKRVDGVVAVDVSFIRNVLQAIGPLKIPEYNETVTVDNFFLLTETYAESNFFPGSTQKKDFLSAVYNALLLRLTEHKDIPYTTLAEAVSKSISQKHILVAMPDPVIQELFTVSNMSSSLEDTRESGSGFVNDFFGISEANFGGNKVNYYLERSIFHDVTLQTKNASSTATIRYHNKSKETSAFGGEYKNYIRFVLPARSELLSVSIDGVRQQTTAAITDPDLFTARRFVPPKELEVEKYEQAGKTVYGMLVFIPPGVKKSISVEYTFPITAGERDLAYSLRVFKQPGTEADPYVFSLTPPVGYKVNKLPKAFKQEGSKITYLTDMSEDREIVLNFSR